MPCAVYVSQAEGGMLTVLHLDAARGTLAPVQSLPGLGRVMPLALSRPTRRLYAARRSAPFAALAFAIDPHDGTLSPHGEAPLPGNTAHLAVDATGRWLFSASYQDDCIAVGPLQADGTPQPATQVLATGRHAHALRATPDNRFAFAAVLGADQVLQYRFDAATGRLAPNDPPVLATRPGSGPRHLDWHPNGRSVCLLHELDATLALLHLDAERGTLTPLQNVPTLPPGFAGTPWAADVHVRPDGRFVYTSERTSSTLACFELDAAGRHATLVQHVDAPAQPRGFQLSADGRWLVAVGEASHTAVLYEIGPDDGQLQRRHELTLGGQPNWVEILALP